MAGRLGDFLNRGGEFLVVGGALVAGATVFNGLVYSFTGQGPLYVLPLWAKVIAMTTVVTYVGNRFWNFGTPTRERRYLRCVNSVGLNLAAFAIQLGTLAVSRTHDHWVFPDDPATSRKIAVGTD